MLSRLFIASFLLLSFISRASHNRSGEITYKRIAPFTKVSGGKVVEAYWFAITVVKYTDDDTQKSGSGQSNQVQDRCVDTLYFGDGTKEFAFRSNGGSPLCSGCVGCGCDHCGELIIDENGYRVKKNVYEFTHEYPMPGTYKIRSSDPNRNADVINMLNSDYQLFYLESILIITAFTGPNNSPEFTVKPVDKACLGKCFTHNPGAYDPDRDSISYQMSTPKGEGGITVTGYFDPEVPAGGTFNINSRSGTFTWCSPTRIGEYNIAFVVQEWRRNTSGKYQLIGSVLRDMQVLVQACPNNDPPRIVVPQDTCVVAGALISKKIRVSDPDVSNVVTLTGHGGAFSAPDPKATLANTTGNGFAADFSWQTSCEHIAQQPYYTTFRAEDNAGASKLVTYTTYAIRVTPPPVKNVTADPAGSNMQVNWSAACNSVSNPLTTYRIYRRNDCSPFIQQPCDPSITPGSGFSLIGTVEPPATSFLDDNDGEGLVVGQNYSYLVVAVYKDGAKSLANAPVCSKLKRDVPLILNVDVLSTSPSAGAVLVRWERPLKTQGNLDTVATPGPYRFDLKRKSGDVFKTVFSTSALYISQLETSYTHSDLNTTLDSNEYFVDFTATGNKAMGGSSKATSVFLGATGADRKVLLSWKHKTPWKNYKYTIYRKDPGSAAFTAIGTSTETSYEDNDKVVNRRHYCYYILAEGEYSDPTILKPLLNKSQEVCVTPVDLTPPCTPTLDVVGDCPGGFITVSWKNVRPICSDDVINYILYYKNTVDEPYQKIFETDSTYFLYDGTAPISGCYAIQAQDSSANLSAMSQDFCIDICPEFELPNIFSPNKDGANDFYKAIKVRQVKEIELVILDRWGNPVYKTNNPYFEWDGTNVLSHNAVSEGTLFYVCTVYEHRVKGMTKRVLKGTIQVVR